MAGCMSPAGFAAAGVPVGVGTGGVPIATGVGRPPAAPTDAPLACTVAGRDAHAVERIAPSPRVRLVGSFRAGSASRQACALSPPSACSGLFLTDARRHAVAMTAAAYAGSL